MLVGELDCQFPAGEPSVNQVIIDKLLSFLARDTIPELIRVLDFGDRPSQPFSRYLWYHW